MISSPACPACGGTNRTPLHQRGEMTLYRCARCDLSWIDPLPEPADLSALYTDAYEGASTSYFAKAEKKLKRSRGRVAQLKRYVPRGRFLDIGCNGGFMTEAAREQGFDAWGIDPDSVSVAYAAKTYPANRFAVAFAEEFFPEDDAGRPVAFDAIYCSEVIEHTPTPNLFAAALHRLLVPGGVAYLTTPDISHWRRPKDLDRWDGFCPPSHVLYFSPQSFAWLMHAHGLEVISRRFNLKPGLKVFVRRK